MELTAGKIAFRLVFALFVGAIAGLLFESVFPAPEAYGIAIAIAIVEFCGSLITAQRGAGGGVRVMLKMGEALLAWPLAAWLLMAIGLHDRGVRIGLAAAVASAMGMLAARHGYGRESARLMAVILAVAIPVYVALSAVMGGDANAMIAAAIACAVAPVTAGAAHVWPEAHHSRLAAASGLCVAAGVAVLAVRVVL